ncbi:MAG: MerR family transcriptional regulator [Roseburia sp.]|nr:MerR family transcriptional regulator [Roseburia sp.]
MTKKYTIREIADLIGISTDAIRLYEKEGLVSPLRDPNNGYRYYGPDEIQRIMGIHLYRQLDASIAEIRNLNTATTLPEVAGYFSTFISQTEQEIAHLQSRLEKLRFMKQHIENMQQGLYSCSIQELPTLYILYQQDFNKTLYENMKDILTSPSFSFGNFCYTLQTNATGTYSPHALEFTVREPMMKVCPWHDKADTLPTIPGCRCLYTVITAPDQNGVEWNLNPIYDYAKKNGITCGMQGYAFYTYTLVVENVITDFYEIYLPIAE